MPRGDGNLYVTFIDFGQGDCAMISCPNGKTAMIDCGTARGEDSDVTTVTDVVYSDKYLQNYNKLDVLILSHPDKDHYSHVSRVLHHDVEIVDLYYSAELRDYRIWGVGNWLDTLANVTAKHAFTLNADSDPVEAHPVLDGKQGMGPECKIYILASNVDIADRALGGEKWKNPASVVTLLVFEDLAFLFCADATSSTEQFLVDNFSDLIRECHVLQVPHHGSEETSSTQDFINVVNPERVVISAARNSGSKLRLPRGEVIKRYLKMSRLADADAHGINYYEDREEEVIVSGTKKRKKTFISAYVADEVTTKNLYITGSNGNVDFDVGP